jgi:chemotaxis response regulator CheB
MLKKKSATKKAVDKKKKGPASARTIQHNAFPIVAIGASTDGLEAVSALFKNLPSDMDMLKFRGLTSLYLPILLEMPV